MIKRYAKRYLDAFASRVAVEVSRRMADDISHRLLTMSPSAGLSMLMLNVAANVVPQDVSPYKLFGGIDDETWFWLHTEAYRRSPSLRKLLPGLPDAAYQRQSVGSAGDESLRQGLDIARTFKEIYERHAGPFSDCKGVLDFGCGWGRIMRFYLKDIEPSRLWGIDVVEKAIEFCKRDLPWCNFARNDPYPPTTFPNDKFGLVFASSVFSHLSEDVHLKWIEEFHRILVPGGLLIASTWGRDMITNCQALRGVQNLPPWQTHLPGLFRDTEHILAAYDSGQFCFDTSREMYGENSKWVGEACIPKQYVSTRWAPLFECLDYILNYEVLRQNIIVVRKK